MMMMMNNHRKANQSSIIDTLCWFGPLAIACWLPRLGPQELNSIRKEMKMPKTNILALLALLLLAAFFQCSVAAEEEKKTDGDADGASDVLDLSEKAYDCETARL